jgi:hypothetical protein
MTARKTLKIQPETKKRLDELKRDGETVDGLLTRAADALEADDQDDGNTLPRCSECTNRAQVWTVEDGDLVCGLCAESDIELNF